MSTVYLIMEVWSTAKYNFILKHIAIIYFRNIHKYMKNMKCFYTASVSSRHRLFSAQYRCALTISGASWIWLVGCRVFAEAEESCSLRVTASFSAASALWKPPTQHTVKNCPSRGYITIISTDFHNRQDRELNDRSLLPVYFMAGLKNWTAWLSALVFQPKCVKVRTVGWFAQYANNPQLGLNTNRGVN